MATGPPRGVQVRGHFAADRRGRSDESDTRPILPETVELISARAKSLEFGLRRDSDVCLTSGLMQLIPSIGRNVPGGSYEIIKKLPQSDGEFEYRIKSMNEPHERVARESELRGV